ncbi:MAG TPA: hypothetical protein VG734_02765 [Lacunisphaera sp.]|nr:hypothetical protein [Lacunisphaera sp.]
MPDLRPITAFGVNLRAASGGLFFGPVGQKMGSAVGPYYRSGWAFLLPYLAAYLLYARLGWPVNPSPGAGIPCLLHLFWLLHFAHFLLAGVALRAWWLGRGEPGDAPNSTLTDRASPVAQVVLAALPWVCLGLFFQIPGVYLEFPADPWQHYGRVNEWSQAVVVTDHSTWKKFSYFLAYTLIGNLSPPSLQLKWFNLYYTGCCLLLCWQYHRLAQAVGLGRRAAMVFVILQVLLFGNNLFGFYRYYGMSSTVFAQLGAVALVRVALAALRARPLCDAPAGLTGPVRFSLAIRSHIGAAVAACALLPLIAFNHVQGLGIAGLGLAAVVIWRLVEWRRSAVAWLVLAAIVLGAATIRWFPRHPALDANYRPAGWLTPWYGFNLFQPSSPAFDRAAVILGLAGLINLGAGFLLLRRNSPAAWLTIIPVLALCHPSVAIPFAQALATAFTYGEGSILIFHRMLMAISPGLALVAVGDNWREIFSLRRTRVESRPRERHLPPLAEGAGFFLLVLMLFSLTTIPPGTRFFNRLFHSLMVPADDLSMQHVIRSPLIEPPLEANKAQVVAGDIPGDRPVLLATPGIGYVLGAAGHVRVPGARKWMMWPTVTPPSLNTSASLESLRHVEPALVRNAPFWPVPNLYSPVSLVGFISGHWLPQELALEHAGQFELFAPDQRPREPRRPPQIWLECRDPALGPAFGSKESGQPVKPIPFEDRGLIDEDTSGRAIDIRAGTSLIFRPIMRTLDGNGRQLAFAIQGPGVHATRIFAGQPSPIGGDTWIFGDVKVHLKEPGTYVVDVAGTTKWPEQSFAVRYRINVSARLTDPVQPRTQ